MILHCMKKDLWEKRKNLDSWGNEELLKDGFIHCSTIEYFHRVLHHFKKDESYVILCIDESKLTSELKYEEDRNTLRFYPHIYGLINTSSVIQVLELLKDESNNYIKNSEFLHISDR